MRTLLTTVSLALMLSAVPAFAQAKPDSVKKPKPAVTMPARPAAPAAAPAPAAPAVPAAAAPAAPSAKKHRKPKAKKPATP